MLAWLFFALGAAVASEPATYKVVAGESRMSVHVGTAGLFKMFGHDHNIEVKGISGSVDWDENDPAASRFGLEVDASSLVVADEELSDGDRAQVQADMESKALASNENPKIVFQSTAVEADKAQGAAHRLKIKGNLSLRGVTKPVEVPVTLEVLCSTKKNGNGNGNGSGGPKPSLRQEDTWFIPDLEAWRAVPIWADASTCRVSMSSLPFGGATFRDRDISEAGRRLLSDQLRQLRREQVKDLFVVSGFTEYALSSEAGRDVESWVAAFEDKVRQIADRPACPEP